MKTENMPKIELHVHLDGSVRPETIMELLPNTKEEDIKGASENLKDYLKKFDIPLKTLEKWITAYNKDHRCFDADYKSQAQIIDDLKRKISSLQRDNEILKKTISLLAKKE